MVKIEAEKRTLKDKKDKVELHYRCKILCNCGGSPYHVIGLKQWQSCKNVLKSNWSKQKCHVGGVKTTMIPVENDKLKKKKRVGLFEEPTCNKARKRLFDEKSTSSESSDDKDMFEAYYRE